MYSSRISMEGAYDLHIHTAPDLFFRYVSDLDAARAARAVGMAGIMLKCHHESTVSRAILTENQVPGVAVYGGIVLNRPVGGINFDAVQAALKGGAKEVWMPTTDSEFHRQTFGSVGSYGLPSMTSDARQKTVTKGISIIDDNGRLISAAIDIIDLITEYDAIFGTSHLSHEESFAVLHYTQRKKTKVLITHPHFRLPNLNLELLQQMTDLGGIAELVAIDYFNLPTEHHPPLTRAQEAIKAIGPDKFILSSDGGQPFNPNPVEAIRVVAESLFEMGISKEWLKQIMCETPAWLVGASK
jgi:hypothetical protein